MQGSSWRRTTSPGRKQSCTADTCSGMPSKKQLSRRRSPGRSAWIMDVMFKKSPPPLRCRSAGYSLIITRGLLQKKDIDPLFCLFVDGMLWNTNRKAADVFASAAFPDVLCGVVQRLPAVRSLSHSSGVLTLARAVSGMEVPARETTCPPTLWKNRVTRRCP